MENVHITRSQKGVNQEILNEVNSLFSNTKIRKNSKSNSNPNQRVQLVPILYTNWACISVVQQTDVGHACVCFNLFKEGCSTHKKMAETLHHKP